MIHIAPLRLSERVRWAELWSEYQVFYGVELPAAVTDNTLYVDSDARSSHAG
jgi:hypothetical protein